MATYNAALKGYVADVPKVVFRRCDGHAYAFTELTAATVTANIETIDINAGWSLFPVAVIPGNSTFTMNFTCGQFDADLFAMANKVNYAKNENYALDTTERHKIENTTITLEHTPLEDSIYIDGMEPITTTTGTVTAGHYLINGKTLTFSSADSIDFVDVIYQYSPFADATQEEKTAGLKTVYEAIVTNKESAIGEASAIWPVYGSGDDCTESAIVGYYVVRVFRARITTIPGMDTSYKSAATFQFELTALDAKRNDEGAYSTAYYRK